MALLSAAKLSDETLRLVHRSGTSAAIDLRLRHAEVHAWFAGLPVYGSLPAPTYPPASYATLWPLIGWESFGAARWLWALSSVAVLAGLTWIVVRESGGSGAWQRAGTALLLLAMNQTGVAIGNGQLVLHVLFPLVTALLIIHRGRGSWREDLIAAGCIIVALTKVTLAAPFLWLVLFAPTLGTSTGTWQFRVRPALLVAASYTLLTMFAAAFQPDGLARQLREWLDVARLVSGRGGDYANLNAWLDAVGVPGLVSIASVVVFAAHGAWLYRYRAVDLWTRLGVTAIVTRFWAYHRLYDDVLIVLALVALCRVVTSSNRSTRQSSIIGRGTGRPARDSAVAIALLTTTMIFMLLPARLGTAGAPWHQIFTISHTSTWVGMLVFLLWQAERLHQINTSTNEVSDNAFSQSVRHGCLRLSHCFSNSSNMGSDAAFAPSSCW